MKVTLDLDELLAKQQITQQEYDKLKAFSQKGTTSVAFNILIGFGVIAVSGALLALLPKATVALAIGALLLIAGIGLIRFGQSQWEVLAQILTIVGALMVGGAVIALYNGAPVAFFAIAAIYALGALFAKSALLSALAVLALGPTVGAQTAYAHASYFLSMQEPLLSIILFSVLGIILFLASLKLPYQYERLSIIAARTCLLLVNLAFWIGSLWGDKVAEGKISPILFSVFWGIGLVATAVWAWYANRRWVLNTAAVFAAIHFYTQWFETLGATPGSILIAGVLALIFAVAIRQINVIMQQNKPAT